MPEAQQMLTGVERIGPAAEAVGQLSSKHSNDDQSEREAAHGLLGATFWVSMPALDEQE